MKATGTISVGLLGLGVVGGGVAKALSQRATMVERRVGRAVCVDRALVRDLGKPRSVSLMVGALTTDPRDLLEDPEVDILVEVLGGEEPARTYIERGIAAGKHIVTANKEVMAKFGPELLTQAAEQGVQLLFEASVGGGIPIIGPLRKDLLANELRSIHAVINGTTNYILTQMAAHGRDFAEALQEAQALGYAEPDPTNDVEGIDAAYKLAILASLAFHTRVRASDVYHEGITRLNARDFRYADELGYAIKLMAIAKRENSTVQVRVHPAFVPADQAIAKVSGVFNAVEVEGDLVGQVLFQGQGAGPLATTSAVVGDVLEVARGIATGAWLASPPTVEEELGVQPMEALVAKYYVRMGVLDRAGVLAQIARVLAENQISIASVIQKEADPAAGTAEIVLMTHPSLEGGMQRALAEMAQLEVVREIGNVVRVEEWPATT